MDGANTICEGYGYGSKLFVVKNAVENKFIMGKIPSGETSLWLGYYNINTIRSTSDKLAYESYNGIPVNKESLITSVDEDGNRNINNDKIINGGGGYRGDNQYMCSNTCADVGGYCGDGVVENGKQKLNFYDSFWVMILLVMLVIMFTILKNVILLLLVEFKKELDPQKLINMVVLIVKKMEVFVEISK